MTEEERQNLIEQIAKIRLEGCDLDDLEDFFYDTQVEYLQESSEEELLEFARDLELTVN